MELTGSSTVTVATGDARTPGAGSRRRGERRGQLGHVYELDSYRDEITRQCRRILGSASEAEDAAQETIVRAWAAFDRFEGRASVRTWLYRIASNVCLDMIRASQRRARPMDLGTTTPAATVLGGGRWTGFGVHAVAEDPADVAVSREDVRSAFAAVSHLSELSCAVLILREVLRWPAKDVADLLATTTASVNSALQRARATVGSADVERPVPVTAEREELVRLCIDAFERADMDSLVGHLALWVRSAPRRAGVECPEPSPVAA